MVSSKDFYDAALTEITQVPQIRLDMGTPVEGDVFKRNGLWHVATTKGEYSAPWILDTRPGTHPPDGLSASHQPMLWQSFLGKEITVGEDLFDEGCAELMNFSEGTPESILFLYVLPYSKREALVEATVFGPQPLGAADLEQPFRTLARERLNGSSQTTGRAEHGILPMGVPVENLRVDPTYVRAGLMAGGARPSSGYAFQRIWRWSQACASALAEGRPPIPHPRDTTLTRAMDSLFLRVLRAYPKLAPDLFLSLFSKVDPVRMARFMSDRGTLADCAAIIASLPSSPFLHELPAAIAAGLALASGREKSSKR
jgi:lycopene beta-cyclase